MSLTDPVASVQRNQTAIVSITGTKFVTPKPYSQFPRNRYLEATLILTQQRLLYQNPDQNLKHFSV